MTTIMNEKVVVVTGAGRGLGRAFAIALAEAGARVLVNDLGGATDGVGADASTAQQVVDEIRALGGVAVANSESVTDWQSAGRILEQAHSELGPVTGLVSNAGILRYDTLEACTQSAWETVLSVNLGGVAAMSHAVANYQRRQSHRRAINIVNICSPAATSPKAGNAAYAAAKAGVNALTISTAEEFAPLGIRVNALAPVARTRMLLAAPQEYHDAMPLPPEGAFDRFEPANVAPLVVYLCSDRCRFTGRVFAAEGDDVYLFDGWSAEHCANNRGQPWSVDSLTDVLSQWPVQEERWEFYPGGRISTHSPTEQTLSSLQSSDSVFNDNNQE